ncbi:uncharacterized protein LOC113069086 [Tachysurus ichikawai]
MFQSETPKAPIRARGIPHPKEHPRPVLLTYESIAKGSKLPASRSSSKPKPYCPHYDNRDHYLNSCETFKRVDYGPDCGLDQRCDSNRSVLTVSLPSTQVYLDRPNRTPRVMLKIVKVLLHNGPHAMEAHVVLDDVSERTLVLFPIVQQFKLSCTPERFTIHHAFTATGLSLAEHNYPVAVLQQAYRHLKDLPLPPVDRVKLLLLIGSDMPHLLTPIRPVFRGPDGGPIAI